MGTGLIMENKIKVLIRNVVKCLVCGQILESKHRHHYVKCKCDNEAFTDGGTIYVRLGAVDLGLIENLSEYTTYDKVEYEAKQKELKIAQDIRDQELLIKLFEKV